MRRTTVSGFAMGAAVVVMVVLLAGCSSLASAISSAMRPPAPEPAATPAPAPQEPQSSSPRSGAGKGAAYQYQFNSFYGSMWTMGWLGYKDSAYKAGQGTIWRFSGSSDPLTYERALLKVNPDSTQWWRFKLDTKKESILYEFLVGTDGKPQKVRYKDPDTGAPVEFVPTESGGPAGPQSAQMSQAELAKHKVDRQTIKVEAGSFPSDHYLWQDDRGGGTGESWVSSEAPGSIVKSVFTSSKDKKVSTVELIKIETGVTTVLGSF
jgi:hypothetical protein